jgi:glyoxylase-like metal-dependent hydrolase (beta-lactamase superfamily II)
VIDGSRGDEPWLVITGDSLLIGDAARPDLASEAVEGATGLYGSLQKLLELPDGVELFPGHVAGSLCGAGMSSKASSTIGFERRFNHALNVDQDEFVQERGFLQSALRKSQQERELLSQIMLGLFGERWHGGTSPASLPRCRVASQPANEPC